MEIQMEKQDICVGIVDDHVMFRKALAAIINNEFAGCRVTLEAGNGFELKTELQKGKVPDIILLDLQMPLMNGYETLSWLGKNHPDVRVIILSMHDTDFIMINLLQNGAKAFLKKNMPPEELKKAICSVKEKGFYYTDCTTRKLFNTLYNDSGNSPDFRKYSLTEKEMRFIQFAATDMTYKEIAKEMKLSLRSVDKIRDRLFFKFEVKNRVSLIIKALHEGVVA